MTLAVVKEKIMAEPSWLRKGLNLNSGPSWLQERRQAAWNQIEQRGLPTVADEEWRYLSLAKLYEADFEKPTVAETGALAEKVAAWKLTAPICWVFVDGIFNAELSVGGDAPHGLSIKRFDDVLPTPSVALKSFLAHEAGFESHPFAALNTASFTDGAVIEVAEGVEIGEAVQLLFVSTAGKTARQMSPRLWVSLGANSGLRLIETYAGLDGGSYFNNAVTEIMMAEGARLEHYRMQYEGSGGFHVGLTAAVQERDSAITSHTVTVGGAFVRNNLMVKLNGEGANATLNGLYVLADQQQCDSHLLIDHAKAFGTSHQLYKGILDGRSKGVFNGKVIVREGAVKTDASQTNKNLVLSREAEVDPKPELEIYNNDVKCSHGATVGQLDEQSLFYLRSRGIPLEEARQMLVRAFAQDVLERLQWDEAREDCEQHLNAKLDREL